MADPIISRRVITGLLITRLRTLTGVTVYRGRVDDRPPVMVDALGAPDSLGRVAPYVVHYSGAGSPEPGDEDLGNQHVDLLYTCQLTLAAGSDEDLDHLADRVVPLVYRWVPPLTGVNSGGFEPPPGYDPGANRRDDTVDPPRYWTPLQLQLVVTT